MKHGGTEIAFIEDPDDYKIELINLTRRGASLIAPMRLANCGLESRWVRHKIATGSDLIYDLLAFAPVQSRYIQEDRCHGYDDYE